MLPSIIRRAGRRFSSTKAKTQVPQYQLPPEKLRALAVIYHQAGSFITPENLSDRIDEAFANEQSHSKMIYFPFVSTKELEGIRRTQRERTKVREWEKDILPPTDRVFSEAMTVREERVIQALYGVELSSDKTRWLPGPDVLQERGLEEDSEESNL